MKRMKSLLVIPALACALFLSACSGKGASDNTGASGSSQTPAASMQSVTSEQSAQSETPAQSDTPAQSGTPERSEEEASGDTGSGPEPSEESEEGLTDEELRMMSEAERIQREFLEEKDFYNIEDVDRRRELALEIVNKLADEGYYIKESIFAGDDMVSYSYSCGAVGGIKLSGFDPYMN